MPNLTEEAEFLQKVIPAESDGSTNREKRRAAQILHRSLPHPGRLKGRLSILRAALGLLTKEEKDRLKNLHETDGHALGEEPSSRAHHQYREPRRIR